MNCKNCDKETSGVYCNNKCQQDYQVSLKESAFRNGEYKGKRLQYSKDRWNRRYLSKVLEEKCNCCGMNQWNGKPIGLEVNHIDGHAYNNVIDNLELLCPNCHSQTDTYKNKGARKSDRRYR